MRQRIAERFLPRPLDDTGIALILYGVLTTLQDPDLVEEVEAPLSSPRPLPPAEDLQKSQTRSFAWRRGICWRD